MLDSTFWQTGELYDMSEICQNVKKVDYQGAEGKSYFYIFK